MVSFCMEATVKRILQATLFYASPKGAKPYRNPMKRAVRYLRAMGEGEKAKVLRRAHDDACLDVHKAERIVQKAKALQDFLNSDADKLTKAADRAKMEPE